MSLCDVIYVVCYAICGAYFDTYTYEEMFLSAPILKYLELVFNKRESRC